jgi:hypothetical protein
LCCRLLSQPLLLLMLLQVIRDSYEYHGLNDLFFFCITALAVTLVSILQQCCRWQQAQLCQQAL